MPSLSSPTPSSASPATPSPPPAAFYYKEIGHTENMNSQRHQPENEGGEAAPEVAVEAVHDDNSAYFKSLPPGWRFCPDDDDLIVHYLQKKVLNEKLPKNRIQDVELYKHEPDHLAQIYSPTGKKEWYFFTPTNRKYKNGLRPDRTAGNGYWKATAGDKNILSNGKHVGYRKTLVFHHGKSPKDGKTNWIMHEFRVLDSIKSRARKGPNDLQLDEWVLCKIYKKPKKASREVDDTESPQEDVDVQIGSDGPSDGYEDFVPAAADTPNNINLSEMVCNYNDEMNDYMGLMINPPSVDELSHAFDQYNLPPLPTEHYYHDLFTDHNGSNKQSISLDDPCVVEPISFTGPPSIINSTHEPRSLATGPANEDRWASNNEDFDYLSQLDFDDIYYWNAYNFVDELEDLFSNN